MFIVNIAKKEFIKLDSNDLLPPLALPFLSYIMSPVEKYEDNIKGRWAGDVVEIRLRVPSGMADISDELMALFWSQLQSAGIDPEAFAAIPEKVAEAILTEQPPGYRN